MLTNLFFSVYEFFNDSSGTESPCPVIDPTWSVQWRQVDKDSLGEGGGCNGHSVSEWKVRAKILLQRSWWSVHKLAEQSYKADCRTGAAISFI